MSKLVEALCISNFKDLPAQQTYNCSLRYTPNSERRVKQHMSIIRTLLVMSWWWLGCSNSGGGEGRWRGEEATRRTSLGIRGRVVEA